MTARDAEEVTVAREQLPDPAPRDARFAVLLLAAGRSTRAGGVDKLLATRDGVTLVGQVAAGLRASRASIMVVVTGHEAGAVRAAVARHVPEARFVHNDAYASGLSTSLNAGLAALAPSIEAVAVCLADMPGIDGAIVDRLFEAWLVAPAPCIVVATAAGRRGNPVVLPASVFAEIGRVTGDVGARAVIAAHADRVVTVEIGAAAAHDLDTREALAAAGFHPVPR